MSDKKTPIVASKPPAAPKPPVVDYSAFGLTQAPGGTLVFGSEADNVKRAAAGQPAVTKVTQSQIGSLMHGENRGIDTKPAIAPATVTDYTNSTSKRLGNSAPEFTSINDAITVDVATAISSLGDPGDAEALISKFKGGDGVKTNPLNNYTNTNYHWRLFLTPDRDLAHSGKSTVDYKPKVFSNVKEYHDLLDKLSQITIAETGLTSFNIKRVSIESLVGPNFTSRSSSATKISMTISEPNGVAFLDALKNAAIEAKTRNFTKCWYYLELTFNGYRAQGTKGEGDIVTRLLSDSPLENGGRWIWQVSITNIETNLDVGGGTYEVTMIPMAETALDTAYRCTPSMVVAEGDKVGEFFDSFKKELNESWNVRTGGAVITYDFVFHPIKNDPRFDTAEKIRGLKLIPQEPDKTYARDMAMINRSKTNPDGPALPGQATIPRAHIPRGSAIPDVVNLIFSNSEQAQNLAKDSSGDPLLPDDSKEAVNSQGFRRSIFFRADPQIVIRGFDPLTNNYMRHITYHIRAFETQNVILSKTQIKQALSPKVQEKMVGALIRGNFLAKRYDYLFTGLNTEVIDIDLKYNLLWNATLPRLVFYSNESAITHAKYNDLLKEGVDAVAQLATLNEQIDDATQEIQSLVDSKEGGINPEERQKKIKAAQDKASELTETRNETIKNVIADRAEAAKLVPQIPEQEIFTGKRVLAETITNPDLRRLPVSFLEHFEESRNEVSNGMVGQAHPGKFIYGAVLNQAYGPLSQQFLTIQMKIKGDPYWIGPSNIEDYVAFYNPDYKWSGLFANYSAGDNTFLLNFRYPLGDDGNGLPKLSQNEAFTGIYQVTKVTHEFSDGQFSQDLEAIRMPLVDVFSAFGVNIIPIAPETATTQDNK